ncbi:MAG: exo-alpha-sialidase [Polyangiaceae bacterium]|nr:exo-alpha-sialidase [Polyangiaceae bacterium]
MMFQLSPVGRALLATSLVGAFIGCGARGGLLEEYGQAGVGGGGGSGGNGGSGAGQTTSVTTGVTTTSTGTTTPTPVNATVISESFDSIFEGETSVVATSFGFVAAAWIAVSQQGEPFIAYAFSTDDGANWAPPVSLQSPDGRVGSDPVLAVDSAGNIYLTWVGFFIGSNGPEDMVVYTSRAPVGATFFEDPVPVSPPNTPNGIFLDKPWITTTAKNSVVVSYARFDTTGASDFAIVTGRSDNGGQSYQLSEVVKDASFNSFFNLAYVCSSLETGRVYTTYLDITQFGQQLEVKTKLAWSDDDGQTWPPGNNVEVSEGELDVAFMDPGCTAVGNEVWVTYGRSPDPLSGESEESQKLNAIMVRHSANGGANFEPGFNVADPTVAKFFMHQDLKAEPTTVLDMVYYAGNQNEDTNGTFRRVRFKTGEVQPLSETVYSPIIFTPDRAVPYWLGDYVGLYVRGTRMYTTYVVNETELSHVAFSAFNL